MTQQEEALPGPSLRLATSLVLSDSSSCRLSEARERRLIIKDCLIKSRPLRSECGQRFGNFNYLRFARSVTSNRGVKITLCLSNTCSGQPNANLGRGHLSL